MRVLYRVFHVEIYEGGGIRFGAELVQKPSYFLPFYLD